MPDEKDGESIDARDDSAFIRAIARAPSRPLDDGGRSATPIPTSKRFVIRRRLGEGGMGIVYEAFDEERHAPVALKTLNRFDGGALARFKREFRALQGLAHPNLVALGELFFENDQWFFTMELLDGVDFVSHVTARESDLSFASTVRESAGRLAARAAVNGEIGAVTSFDEPKLRSGLRQLLEGLSALHAVDKVHRDIKPSNVLVTREGRVVLLDFGLVTEASTEDRSTGSAVVGTPAYMAPEQAASREVGPSADLYAVGVMLYEILTGRLPFKGPQLQILLDKQTREPAPPSSVAAGVPEDLNALCVKLLRFDSALRPSAAEVLRAFAVAPASGSIFPRGSSDAAIFVGRSQELAELGAAFEVTAKGGLSTVLVCGESGIGKSYLVRRFTGLLMAEHPTAMLLEGRCYERETVPYKTLDGIVDALSRSLSRMNPIDIGTLLPARSATLAQVFPVMLRIPQVAKEHAALTLTIEPHELRQRAFVALRDLFTRVAVRRPTVVVIDDLQWADEDGLRALAEVLRPPEAPPLLLLGTVRVASSGDDAGFKRVRAVIPGEARVIDLGRLGRDEARALAVAVLRRSDASDADPEAIAAEAGGHPLFVEELARHVALGGSAREDVKLDDSIWSRILQQEGATREMAELVAIAGKPIPQEVAAAAAHVEPAEFNRRAATLRVSNLVRTGGARWADAIEPYHDRVREAVLARIDPARKRELHEALAVAFEASSHDDPEMLAAHWREAGNTARAARYAARAGDQASKTLAFDRAAQWYAQALELMPDANTGRRELRIKLGDALSSGGRGALAAAEFEAAAAESPPLEALDLMRRAAEELLKTGHVDQGKALLRDVLARTHERFPESPVATIFWLLVVRLQLWLRGLKFTERDPAAQDRLALVRIDALASAGLGLVMTETFLGAYFQGRCLLRSMKAGDTRRTAHALAFEASYQAAGGATATTLAYLAVARRLAERVGTPDAVALGDVVEGHALYISGDWSQSVSLFARAEATFRDRCVGVHWYINTACIVLLDAMRYAGRYEDLRQRHGAIVRDAVERGDRYTVLMMKCGSAFWVAVAEDRRLDARALLDEVKDDLPAGAFQIWHYSHLVAGIYLDLYCGSKPGEAHARLVAAAPSIRRSLFSLVMSLEVPRRFLLAQCALASAEEDATGGARWIAEARRRVASLRRLPERRARALATLHGAGVVACEGARDAAVAQLRTAIVELDAAGLRAFAAGARRRLGRILGGDEGAALAESVQAYEEEEGIVNGEAFARLHAPGFGRLESRA